MEKNNHRWFWPDIKKILIVAIISSLIGAMAASFITTSILYGRQQYQNKPETKTPQITQNQESIILILRAYSSRSWNSHYPC